MTKTTRFTGRFLKILLLSSGIFFIALCLIAFTTLPFRALHNLATSNSRIEKKPEIIVMLSGAGIPSETGLIRAFYTAKLALECPSAMVIVAVPGDTADSLGDPRRVAAELALRGVNPERIRFENAGKNTRGQAQMIAVMIKPEKFSTSVTLVSSPEQMKRAVLSFRKCGFTCVSGLPAFESSLQTDLTFNDNDLNGNKMAPPIGNNLQVRYQFWNHLKYEVIVIREYAALAWYKLRGWI